MSAAASSLALTGSGFSEGFVAGGAAGGAVVGAGWLVLVALLLLYRSAEAWEPPDLLLQQNQSL